MGISFREVELVNYMYIAKLCTRIDYRANWTNRAEFN